MWNVKSEGDAFATTTGSTRITADNLSLSVWTLMQRANSFAVNGVLWSAGATVSNVVFTASALQNQGNVVFSAINQAGDII
jgi:hypothetical protein